MVKCSSCLSEIPETSRFCLSCGSAVAAGANGDATVAATIAMQASLSSSSLSSGVADFDEGRFVPGTLLAERYRILSRLGKGGMGEVYRANDLRLGQTVALKFLPEATTQSPAMLARFYNEVRIARQVTHPNVCRVYDIGDVNGQPFISMQFIDGEDLASLLMRIGRVPEDKAIEITRRLCAGLAAAHAQGVLHRDLKPANIMIDGRGQVLITDFGLAGLAEEIRGAEIHSGTPAYMSPEQLAGLEVTFKSDIYALGLVLYEMFTGRRAYEADTLAELVRMRQESRPVEISIVVRDLDPAIEKIILRCLDPDPKHRPSSALALSAALPGGDPLAAALAAGETPSPEMVAASGTKEGLRPAIAIACLTFILVALGFVTFFNSRQMLVSMTNLEMPPEALAVQAHKTIRQFGYMAADVDRAWGLDYEWGYLDYVQKQVGVRANWQSLANGQPPVIDFWYRESPVPLEMISRTGRVTLNDPPPRISGMTAITLDPQGRMMSFSAVPPQVDESAPAANVPDAAPLFAAAGLDLGKFKTSNPRWTPLLSSDARAAWTGAFPGRPENPLRIEAAWWRGKPVYFQIVGPWTTPGRMPANQNNGASDYTWIAVELALLAFGSLLAWRNLRQGRGDRQGAIRIAAFAFFATLLNTLLAVHFGSPAWGVLLFTTALGMSLLVGSELWLAYMALEPTVRRRWPRILITWTRIISGKWKDPLVCRDVLIGLIVALGYDLLFSIETAVERHMGRPPTPSITLSSLLGFRFAASAVFERVQGSLIGALAFFLLFFVIRMIVRKEWVAGVLFVLLFALGRGLPDDYAIPTTVTYMVVYGIVIAMLLRFGLLSLVVAIFATDLINMMVFTGNFSAWYGMPSLMAIAIVTGMAIVAFRNALGGQRLLAGFLDQ